MIIRIHQAGKSFKGLGTYLTHDPRATSAERVGWTHTLNLAHDHVPSAVDEMVWTARNAELLKQEAGIRAGGRATENEVKHISLNWSPEEAPTPTHMIETTEAFLRHMNWQDHQALLVAHTDKTHPHVHVMLNTIHPETGLHLDDDFERRRAQKWARGYEEENGRVFCAQRFINVCEREDAPTRPAWMAFQEKQIEFERDEKIRQDQIPKFPEQPENPMDANAAYWKKLKEIQRYERDVFFARGKLEFAELRNSIYREIREEFRERWAEFYAVQKKGGDAATVMALKKDLITEQKELLKLERDWACVELKESRDIRYRELLDDQRDIRYRMRSRQESGLDNAIFLLAIGERHTSDDRPIPSFQDVAAEAAMRPVAERGNQRDPFVALRGDRSGIKSGADVGASIATGLGFGVLSILGGVADGLTGSAPAPQPKQRGPEVRVDPFDGALEVARRRQQIEEEEGDSERRRKQRSYGE
jgi:hypothetical protein